MKALLSLIFTAYSLFSIAFPIVHAIETGGDFSVETDCGHSEFASTEISDGGYQDACADFIQNFGSDRTRSNAVEAPETNGAANPVPFAVFRFHSVPPTRNAPTKTIVRTHSPPALVGIVKIQT